MKQDYSYGIIPLRLHGKTWQVLLVQHHAGHWAFPKGHADQDESPLQTAERELLEETGLRIQKILSTEPINEHYFFRMNHQLISKIVQYFLAIVEPGEILIQQEEIKDSQWLNLDDAFQKITFKEGQALCLKVIQFLKMFHLCN